MKLQSDDEGFDVGQTQFVHIEKQLISLSVKVPAANQLVSLRVSDQTNCILTSINLVAYPTALDLPYNQRSLSKSLSQERLTPSSQQPQILQSHFFDRRYQYKCVYNKLQMKINYKGEMSSIFRDFQFHLDYVPQNYKLFADKDQKIANNLEFSSNFQSGNLLFAYWCPMSESYFLILHNDINSHGYTQWFYFRVRNREKTRARFKICNLIKASAHFRQGMKASVFSMEQKRRCNRNWFKGGECYNFYRNNLMRQKDSTKSYHCLEFSYTFEYPSDQVYFAMNVPYTYTQLLRQLKMIDQRDRPAGVVFRKRNLTYTVSNNDIKLVEIYKEGKDTRTIIVIARQHPCETVSSFVVEGLMKFLVSGDRIADELLNEYHFYILPMVNPDGVVHGQSRLNLTGVDINRQWTSINKNLSFEAFVIYNWITKLSGQTKIQYVFDLHGHSKKQNTFGYFSDTKLQTRAFAYSMAQMSNLFDYDSCTFGISQDKQKTFRSMVYGLGIRNAVTIQTSYYGRQLTNNCVQYFTTEDLHHIGVVLLKSIHKFTNEKSTEEMIAAFQKNQKLRQLQKEQKQNSDSDPEGDYLNEQQRQLIVNNKKQVKEEKARANVKSSASKYSENSSMATSGFQLRSMHRTISRSNERYSVVRHKTQPDEAQTKPMFDNMRLKSKVYTAKPKPTNRSFMNATSHNFRTIRSQSQAGDRKYSSSKTVTTYPTNIHPYLSNFNTTFTTITKKQQQSKSKYTQEMERVLPFSLFVRYPKRLISGKLAKRQQQKQILNQKQHSNYTLLKQLMNISSFSNL